MALRFKLLFVVLWAIGILVVICTSDAEAFVYDQTLNYVLDFTPDFSELLITSDVGLTDAFYLLQKAGHVLLFGILYLLVFNWLDNRKNAFFICSLFALSSEVIQLFFQRDGRLLDVGFDLMGIFLAYGLCNSLKKLKDADANNSF